MSALTEEERETARRLLRKLGRIFGLVVFPLFVVFACFHGVKDITVADADTLYFHYWELREFPPHRAVQRVKLRSFIAPAPGQASLDEHGNVVVADLRAKARARLEHFAEHAVCHKPRRYDNGEFGCLEIDTLAERESATSSIRSLMLEEGLGWDPRARPGRQSAPQTRACLNKVGLWAGGPFQIHPDDLRRWRETGGPKPKPRHCIPY